MIALLRVLLGFQMKLYWASWNEIVCIGSRDLSGGMMF